MDMVLIEAELTDFDGVVFLELFERVNDDLLHWLSEH